MTLELVRAPAGKFPMGSDQANDQKAFREELPQPTLYLPGYRMGKYPVTNAQYAAFVKATRHKVPENWIGGQTLSVPGH